jgi:hypothetical protein
MVPDPLTGYRGLNISQLAFWSLLLRHPSSEWGGHQSYIALGDGVLHAVHYQNHCPLQDKSQVISSMGMLVSVLPGPSPRKAIT